MSASIRLSLYKWHIRLMGSLIPALVFARPRWNKLLERVLRGGTLNLINRGKLATTEARSGWQRPESVPYPSVWSRFSGAKEIDGVMPTFWIQDIPEEQFDVVVGIMLSGFSNDEPLSVHSKISSDAVSMSESRKVWEVALKDKVGLICYMENSDPSGQPIIAGMNITYVKTKNEEYPKIEGRALSKILHTINYLSKMKDEFEVMKQEQYMSAVGLYVLPKFRGQAIGLELLKAREPLCKAVGLKATGTVFSAIGSQIVAAKAGFQELLVISYADLEKAEPRLKYPGIEKHTKNLKYMYKIYQ